MLDEAQGSSGRCGASAAHPSHGETPATQGQSKCTRHAAECTRVRQPSVAMLRSAERLMRKEGRELGNSERPCISRESMWRT
jgi:hypothetical protein